MATTTGAPNPKSIVHVIPFSAAPAALAAAGPGAGAGPVPPVAKYTVLWTNDGPAALERGIVRQVEGGAYGVQEVLRRAPGRYPGHVL